MKTCPVCNSRTFDDATQCFGCLHSFTEAPDVADLGNFQVRAMDESWFFEVEQDTANQASVPCAQDARKDKAPTARPRPALVGPASFVLSLMPTRVESGQIAWACTIEAART